MKPLATILFSLLVSFAHCQCKVRTSYRPDGTIIRYVVPVQVGNGAGCEVGLSLQTNGEAFFLNTTVRYFTEAKTTMGDLKIQLANGQQLFLKQYTSQLSTLGSSDISLNIFWLTDNDVSKLQKSPLELLIFTESTGKVQIIKPGMNNRAAMQQINCILNNQ